MKLLPTSTALTCVFLNAVLAFPADTLVPHRKQCRPNVLSCSEQSDGADSCCVPTYGRVALAQQWHQQLGPKNEFTLHGLWPDKCEGSAKLGYCDKMRGRDDVEKIIKKTDIYGKMKMYWPSFKPTPRYPANNCFWSHEWSKHGTCVTTLDPKCGYDLDRAIYTYFNTTLALREQYDIYKVLKKHKITPIPSNMANDDKNMYSVQAILDAIKKEWNYTAAVYCKQRDPLEIVLVFNVRNKDTYELTDAIETVHDCKNASVWYLEKQPLDKRT